MSKLCLRAVSKHSMNLREIYDRASWIHLGILSFLFKIQHRNVWWNLSKMYSPFRCHTWPHFSYPSIEKIMFKIIFNYFVEEENVYDNPLPSLRANFASNLSCSVVILRTAKVNKPQNSNRLKIDEWIDWLKNWSNLLNEAYRLDSLIHYETLVFTNAWHSPKVTKCCQPGFLLSSKIHNKIVLDFDF